MSFGQITVFGGSGFLGRQIVRRLAGDGAAVRVAVRHPERASFLTEVGTAGLITTMHADVWDEATVGPAVAGSDAVVNTVGHYVERGRVLMKRDNVVGPKALSFAELGLAPSAVEEILPSYLGRRRGRPAR
jgi:NADH dehydrogenase